jgi:hypothetical protein
LCRATRAAEYVNFPRGVEARLIDIIFKGRVGGNRQRAEHGLVVAGFGLRKGTGSVHRRQEAGHGDAILLPGFAHACLRDL